MPPATDHLTRLQPVDVARRLRSAGGLAFFDDVTRQGRWHGDWIACGEPAAFGGCLASSVPAPESGTFDVLVLGYDSTWQVLRYQEWLHRDPAGRWSGSASLAERALTTSSPASPPPASVARLGSPVARNDFLAAVAAAKEHIAAGTIYQVNLSYPVHAPWPEPDDGWQTYERLRRVSPAPHATYLRLPDGTRVLSASPETFLAIEGDRVLTRPIKGTRPRLTDPAADARQQSALLSSPKERAELVMITDLERNDLGRIAVTGSVAVDPFCQLESFAQVHHLVSTVHATLRPGIGLAEILLASFPGGSITGAPKSTALRIIQELEPHPRGLYTGALGFRCGHRTVLNIAIRTATLKEGRLAFHLGAGIVDGSDPATEYRETIHKGRGIAQALGRDLDADLDCMEGEWI